MSGPGWDFGTEHLRLVIDKLNQHVCRDCKKEFPDGYTDLSTEQKLDLSLGTSCGAEFMFEEFKNYDEYCRKLGE